SNAKPRSADAPNATRQMLDELDALMERMLALPVNELEPQAAAEQEAAEQAPQAGTVAATLTMFDAPPLIESTLPAPRPPASTDVNRIAAEWITPPSYTAPAEDEDRVSIEIPGYPPPLDSLENSDTLVQDAWDQNQRVA